MVNKFFNLKLLMLFLVLGSAFSLRAQQDPQYTQFMYNKLPLNAAYTGAREVLSIRALYRTQWTGQKGGGIPGAPQTASVSIHSPLKNEHFAIGFYYVNDRLGVTQTNEFDATYAYRLNLGKKVKLSIGINAGMYWYKLDARNSTLVQPNDPAFNQNISRILPDVGAGLYIYHPNFYFGFGAPNFIRGDLTNKNQDGSFSKRTSHFTVMAGGVIPCGKVLSIRPQILYRYLASGEQRIPHTLDFNISLLIYNRVNIGGQYRTSVRNRNQGVHLTDGDSFDAMLEVWPTKQLMIGYSYDYILTKLGNYNAGSHEIIVGYDFSFEKKKVITPRYF